MALARAFHCPACGGEVDESARRCPYCRAPLATVRCATCYHMNPPHAVHCSGCGRELGLEPLGETSGAVCPRCQGELEAFREGPGTLLDCRNCGGQFVENALLQVLLDRQRTVRQGLPPSAPPRPLPETTVRYLPCPACASLMQRKNFGRASGVIVDVCPRHGIWFDAGELPRVLAFVASGGLERAEARRLEEERRTRRTSPGGTFDTPPLSRSGEDSMDLVVLDELADAARAMMTYLRGILPKK